MKLFVGALSAALLALCSAQDRIPITDKNGKLRTPICEDVAQSEDELPALARGNIGTGLGAGANLGARGLVGRGKRQAGNGVFNEEDTPFVWFTSSEATDGDSCEALSASKKLNRGPVIVPLGTYNVCVKFFAASRWFYTKGSNAPCDPDEQCCEWFPPRQCTRRNQVPVWFELPQGSTCDEAFAQGAEPRPGVEYLRNHAVGDQSAICIYTNPDADPSETPIFDTVPIRVAFCGEGCCIFDRL